ncbi:MAG: CPBP family intramembrane metalloprotease [Chloroflexi bacterium]|nr:CPBP family intramembrane metalloprotease [Chloroflexota bacterium]
MKTLICPNQLHIYYALRLIFIWESWFTGGYGFNAAGPSHARMILVAVVSYWDRIKDMLRRLVHWRVGGVWWAIALSGPPILVLLSIGAHVLTGGDAPSFIFWKKEALMAPFLMLVLLSPMGGPGGEEPFGWRGYVQPHLEKTWGKWSPLIISLIIGIAWAVWHLPEFYNPSSTQYAIGLGFILPMTIMWIAHSVIMTWLYNKTGGSVLVSGVIYHLMIDISSATMLADFSMSGMTEGIPQLDLRLLSINIFVFAIAALVLVIATKGRLGYIADSTLD